MTFMFSDCGSITLDNLYILGSYIDLVPLPRGLQECYEPFSAALGMIPGP